MLHCHILSHEEMDMMRPQAVAVPPVSARMDWADTISGSNLVLSWNDNSISETGYGGPAVDQMAARPGPNVGVVELAAQRAEHEWGTCAPSSTTPHACRARPTPTGSLALNTVGYGGAYPVHDGAVRTGIADHTRSRAGSAVERKCSGCGLGALGRALQSRSTQPTMPNTSDEITDPICSQLSLHGQPEHPPGCRE